MCNVKTFPERKKNFIILRISFFLSVEEIAYYIYGVHTTFELLYIVMLLGEVSMPSRDIL